ncbi:hypothetical protein SAMN05421780_102462 [Flexibacter flexilis DSM 6793]|uniref:Uncharacterized protein n=1 Tax=Flexibacter flexilis DSM 6793 TaxID=927664 RepID=A0A1I1G6F7_9BACT|nr:hypothetical protein [Flexibacter flexilis]SFC06916.1 hypothetical protein SAMN05421780_102462 [Flexibacter flexilis DSM 6793]
MKNTQSFFPAETKIYMGFPTNIVIFFAVGVIFILVGFSGFYFNETQAIWPSLILGNILIGIGFWELSRRKKYSNQPQIVLNERGIQVIGHDFAEWKEIKYARVAASGAATSCLVFTHKDKEISVSLVGLNVKDDKLEIMLSHYRKSAK